MTLQNSDRAKVVAAAQNLADRGVYTSALSELVAVRSESQRAGADLQGYLADHMKPRLDKLGFACEILPNDDPGGGPFLIGTRHESSRFPTVLIYGHGDVVFGQDDQWDQGLNPFSLCVKGDRLYGRGTADNKSQHLINILALEVVLAERGALGFNVKILLEMSEETGSPGLETFCQAHRETLAADVLIASDGPRLQVDTPTVFLGARGGLGFDLSVNLRDGAHHSGNWGGLLADPAIILAHALASLTDARGQLAIPDWRPTSLTPDIRAALADLPIVNGDGPQIDEDWGEVDLTPAERVFGWNSFAILAMTSGVPDAPQNAISGTARASCQLRFVVGTDPSAVIPSLRRHLDANGFESVQISDSGGYFPATRLDPDNSWVRFVCDSLRQTSGQSPHVLPNLAGSLPNQCFSDILGLPTVWVPHSYRACAQHAPNEHALLSLGRDALGLMAGLFWDLSNTH
ncbi:MAG: M20 family metallopeptidase [Sedimentitalea sp.]